MSKALRVLWIMVLLSACLTAGALAKEPTREPIGPSPAVALDAGLYSQSDLSVMFVENVGQFPQEVRFRVYGGDRDLWLTDDAIFITLLAGDGSQSSARSEYELEHSTETHLGPQTGRRGVHLKLSFPGANASRTLRPLRRLPTVVSYFIGGDRRKWQTDVPVWGAVRYERLYPGLDLVLAPDADGLGLMWIARPDANLYAPRIKVEGADSIELQGSSLHLDTAVGAIDFQVPAVLGATEPSATDHATLQHDELLLPLPGLVQAPGFLGLGAPPVGHNEIASPLIRSADSYGRSLAEGQGAEAQGVSDLVYSTYLGGSAGNISLGIAVDSSGAAYVAGTTWSPDFPTTPGAFDTDLGGGYDAFVAKLNADGSELVYCTFLGGSDGDMLTRAIAVDMSGSVYVAGGTSSSDFPTTPGAFDITYDAEGDIFVAKLNADGSELVYSTFLGGSSGEGSHSDIAVDGSGAAFVTGETSSSDFPTTPGAFDTSLDGWDDAFVTKLNATGSDLTYSTFLGGSGGDGNSSIAVDGVGAAFVLGETNSTNFPTTHGAFDTSLGGFEDAFVAKLKPDGSALAYATFLGGSDSEGEYGSIAVDESGMAYVTADTWSTDFPTTPGAFDTTFNSDSRWEKDAFVAKLNAEGSTLAYASFLGGSAEDYGYGICVDSSGAALVVGRTSSPDFPVTPDGFETSCKGDDAYLVKVSPVGDAIVYATFLGGSGGDESHALAIDGTGAVYLSGITASFDFPTTHGAFDRIYSGGWSDAFVTKVFAGDFDTDGVPDRVENNAPGGGDGNADGTLDRQQSNVASLPNSEDGQYVTLVSPTGTNLVDVATVDNPSPGDAPPGVDFPIGFFEFVVQGITPGGSTQVTLLLPPGMAVDNYYKHGPTPDNLSDHWYEFLFDGVTGAEIYSDRVELHFVDGQRGDDDLSADGQITEPGAPGAIPNRPPQVDAGGPYVADEGSSVLLEASGEDPDGDALTFAWDLDNDGTFETPGQSVTFSAADLDGSSTHIIAVQASDSGGLSDTDQTTVEVLNVAPTVGEITAPIDPVEVNTVVNTTASFSDPGVPDAHTADWDWGDGISTRQENVTSPVLANHAYTAGGIYTIQLVVTDDDDGSGQSVFQYVVVYDPEGGFVTGGGWIDSPPEAYRPDLALTGKATFGFVSKYKRGASAPTGQTEFQFKVANLNFHSDTYDWLVVAGARAQFKGVGTINGEGAYKFMLTGLDADINANDSFEVDRFRIKIWEEDEFGTETVVYDNGLGVDHDDDNATTEIGGGSIVIHKAK